jgi:hypothetical protein
MVTTPSAAAISTPPISMPLAVVRTFLTLLLKSLSSAAFGVAELWTASAGFAGCAGAAADF